MESPTDGKQNDGENSTTLQNDSAVSTPSVSSSVTRQPSRMEGSSNSPSNPSDEVTRTPKKERHVKKERAPKKEKTPKKEGVKSMNILNLFRQARKAEEKEGDHANKKVSTTTSTTKGGDSDKEDTDEVEEIEVIEIENDHAGSTEKKKRPAPASSSSSLTQPDANVDIFAEIAALHSANLSPLPHHDLYTQFIEHMQEGSRLYAQRSHALRGRIRAVLKKKEKKEKKVEAMGNMDVIDIEKLKEEEKQEKGVHAMDVEESAEDDAMIEIVNEFDSDDENTTTTTTTTTKGKRSNSHSSSHSPGAEQIADIAPPVLSTLSYSSSSGHSSLSTATFTINKNALSTDDLPLLPATLGFRYLQPDTDMKPKQVFYGISHRTSKIVSGRTPLLRDLEIDYDEMDDEDEMNEGEEEEELGDDCNDTESEEQEEEEGEDVSNHLDYGDGFLAEEDRQAGDDDLTAEERSKLMFHLVSGNKGKQKRLVTSSTPFIVDVAKNGLPQELQPCMVVMGDPLFFAEKVAELRSRRLEVAIGTGGGRAGPSSSSSSIPTTTAVTGDISSPSGSMYAHSDSSNTHAEAGIGKTRSSAKRVSMTDEMVRTMCSMIQGQSMTIPQIVEQMQEQYPGLPKRQVGK